jgi:very-short-patch-repair endonuclease
VAEFNESVEEYFDDLKEEYVENLVEYHSRMGTEPRDLELSVYDEWWRRLMERAESPIEQILGTRLLFGSDGYTAIFYADEIVDFSFPDTATILTPQANIGRYRADFLIQCCDRGHRKSVIVECDGHAFHEKTKDQAKRDKARDRFFTAEGYSVLRFTGSEIYSDPESCAEEIEQLLISMMHELFSLRAIGKPEAVYAGDDTGRKVAIDA